MLLLLLQHVNIKIHSFPKFVFSKKTTSWFHDFQMYRDSHGIQCTNFHIDHQILIVILTAKNVKCVYNVDMPTVQSLSLKKTAQKIDYIYIYNTKKFSSPICCFMHHKLWSRITPLKRSASSPELLPGSVRWLLWFFSSFCTSMVMPAEYS